MLFGPEVVKSDFSSGVPTIYLLVVVDEEKGDRVSSFFTNPKSPILTFKFEFRKILLGFRSR